MTPNLFGNSAALFLEASQPGVSAPAQRKQQLPPAQVQSKQLTKPKATPKYKWRIVWRNVVAFLYLHIGALYGLYLVFAGARFYTFLFSESLWIVEVYKKITQHFLTFYFRRCPGNIRGCRHYRRSPQTLGPQIIQSQVAPEVNSDDWPNSCFSSKSFIGHFCCTYATTNRKKSFLFLQNHLFEWVRDHRVHHKFTDTDADPHNAQRGFFFSHIGWLMLRKHPDVIKKGALVDMSDLEKDPIVVWQRRCVNVFDGSVEQRHFLLAVQVKSYPLWINHEKFIYFDWPYKNDICSYNAFFLSLKER